MNEKNKNIEKSSTTDANFFKENENSTTSQTPEYYGVLINDAYQFVPINEARNIIAEQQRQLQAFINKLHEVDETSKIIKDYFNKSTNINNQLLYRYRKLLDWIFRGGISILVLSLLLIALPLFLFILKFNSNQSLDTLKNILYWIVGIYGASNIGAISVIGLSAFGFKKQYDSLEKRLDRLESRVDNLYSNRS